MSGSQKQLEQILQSEKDKLREEGYSRKMCIDAYLSIPVMKNVSPTQPLLGSWIARS